MAKHTIRVILDIAITDVIGSAPLEQVALAVANDLDGTIWEDTADVHKPDGSYDYTVDYSVDAAYLPENWEVKT